MAVENQPLVKVSDKLDLSCQTWMKRVCRNTEWLKPMFYHYCHLRKCNEFVWKHNFFSSLDANLFVKTAVHIPNLCSLVGYIALFWLVKSNSIYNCPGRAMFFCFRGRFWICFWVPGSMLSCFSDFLLFCFSASLLFLLLCFSCFSAFLFFAFPASLLFCFSVFPASFYFYYSTFLFFSHVILLLHFLLLCLVASCFYCIFVFHFLLLYFVLFVS